MKLLSILLFLISVTAFFGGYGLIFQNGFNMPTTWLEGSPFKNYIGLGLILFFIVGGTHLIASVTLWLNTKFSKELAVIAGFGMIIFEFFELYITKQPHLLQIAYFFLGIFVISVIGLNYHLKLRKYDL